MNPIDRRTFLKRGALVAGAATLRLPLDAPPAKAATKAVKQTPAPGQAYAAPYSVTTSSALSQDYFDTAAVLMDSADDVVAPFLIGGQVGALVLSSSNGALSLLQPDSSQSSGWSFTAVPDPNDSSGGSPLTGVQSVALGDWDGITYAIVIFSAGYGNVGFPSWVWLMNAQDGTGWQWQAVPDYGLESDVGALQTGSDTSGNPYFYAFNGDNSFYLWSPSTSGDYALVTSLRGVDLNEPSLLWDASSSPASGAGVWGLDAKGFPVYYAQTDQYDLTKTAVTGTSLVSQLWQGWAVEFDSPVLGAVIQDAAGDLNYTSVAVSEYLGSFPSLTPNQVVPWFTSDGVGSFAVLTPDMSTSPPTSVLNVVTGYVDSTLQFNAPIAIDDSFQAIFGLPTDPAQSTLFAIADNLTLWVLTRDTNTADPNLAGVWVPTQIMQAGVSAQEMTNWRTQITVLDTNGIGVAGADVLVTPDRTVGVWQVGGSTAMTPADGHTFTTNDFGQITLAAVTWALEAPQWTVQLVDENANPSGSPVTELPDGDVHSFLAGTGSLPTLGMLTASSITSLSPATGATAAGAVVSGLNQTMKVGLSSGPPKVGDVNQFTLDFSSGTPQYSYGTATSLSRAPAVSILSLESSDWWDSIKHDLHSLEHSIRKGLTAMESVAAEWDDDLKSWAINLGLAIEGLGTQIAQFVVYDVHTAITAIHGIFNAIGADIDEVVSWIRMGLDDVIGHSEANAQVVLGWMSTEFPAFAVTQLDDIGTLADGTFNGLKADIKGWIDDIGTSIGGSSFTDLLTTPSSSTATVGSAGSALTDITNILTGVHHNWLIDKIKSAVDGGPPNFASNSTLRSDMQSIDAGYQTFGGDSQFSTIASNMWSSLDNGGAISQGSDFKDLALSVLLSAVEAGLDDLVDLADDVVNDTLTLMKDTVDGLADSLTTTSPGAQLIVDVLSKLGVHADLSYGHIASMVAMFPTTLVYQFATEDGSLLFPADAYTASTSSVQLVTAATPAPDDFTLSLKYTHAVARAVLSVFQTVTDVNALKSGYTAGMNTMPKSVLVVTPLLSLLIAACTYPGTKTDGKTAVPFTTPPNTDGVAADLVVAEMACNWALGLMGLAFAIYPPGADSLIRGDFALALTEIVAIGDMVVTITADALKGADAFTIATQALERTPPVTTFGVFRPVVDATDSISFFVKTVSDIAIDLAAGGMLLDAAIKSA